MIMVNSELRKTVTQRFNVTHWMLNKEKTENGRETLWLFYLPDPTPSLVQWVVLMTIAHNPCVDLWSLLPERGEQTLFIYIKKKKLCLCVLTAWRGLPQESWDKCMLICFSSNYRHDSWQKSRRHSTKIL